MYLEQVPDEVVKVMKILNTAGYETRLVGGCVRDMVRGIEPKDYDLATQALPLIAKEILKKNAVPTIDTGLQHGTITAILNGMPIEITTLRVDTDTDGRHAEVEFTDSFAVDAARRDFTMNGMSIDMDDKLYDYFGGMNDIRNERIVFIGDKYQRIREDYLRVLRMYRFSAQSFFSVPHISITEEIKAGLKSLSVERVWSEVSKILLGSNAPDVMFDMHTSGILDILEIPFQSVRVMDEYWSSKNPVTVLTSQIRGAERFELFADKYKLSNNERDLGMFLIRNTDRPWTVETLQRMVNVERVSREYIEQIGIVYQLPVPYVDHVFENRSVFPVNGYDLLTAGYRPGPGLGDELERLIDLWAESGYTMTKETLVSAIKLI